MGWFSKDSCVIRGCQNEGNYSCDATGCRNYVCKMHLHAVEDKQGRTITVCQECYDKGRT
jgi:hypothetical protein